MDKPVKRKVAITTSTKISFVLAVSALIICALWFYVFAIPTIGTYNSANTDDPTIDYIETTTPNRFSDNAAISDQIQTDPYVSTPTIDWVQGEMPYLYQKDARWKDIAYGNGVIGDSGCGPTSLNMVYIYLTGNTDMTPPDMCTFATDNGYLENGKLTSWTLLEEGAAKLGLKATGLYINSDILTDTLLSGHPVIASLYPGEFTDVGHFIVIAGIDPSGNLIIRDPNSPEHSHTTYDINRILSQTRALWSYSLL